MNKQEIEKIKVLLADDHAVVRTGIRQFLETSDDIEVIVEVGDGNKAKQKIEELLPDVAVLDIQMPEATGIEVTRWVRATYPQVGVLVLTAYDDDPYIAAVLQAGANGYILKTASPEEIIEAVKDVFSGKSVLDPIVTKKLFLQMQGQQDQFQFEALTDREIEVLTLVAKGHTNKAVGVQLGISDRTVQGHLAHIFNKLQAASRTEAVMKSVSLGLLPSDIVQYE